MPSANFKNGVEELNKRLRKLAEVMPARAVTTVQKKIAIDVFAGCIKRTPVDTGRARGGWQITIDAPTPRKSTQPEEGKVGDAGGRTFDAGLLELGKLAPFKIVFITNPVEYVMVLDLGGFVPTDPKDSAVSNYLRARGRSKREKARALAELGDEGAPRVKGGYSIQAPLGITSGALHDAMGGLP